MKKVLRNLKRLKKSLTEFKKSYTNLIKNSIVLENINKLGSIPEYPFSESFDKINIEEWIEKFSANVDKEVLRIYRENGMIYDKKSASEYLEMPIITFDRNVKKYLPLYKEWSVFSDSIENSNGKKNFYTKDFCDFIKEQKMIK